MIAYVLKFSRSQVIGDVVGETIFSTSDMFFRDNNCQFSSLHYEAGTQYLTGEFATSSGAAVTF